MPLPPPAPTPSFATAAGHTRVEASDERELLPLDRVDALPAGLDGHDGLNRYDGPSAPSTAATNDLEAVRAWLEACSDLSEETQRAYRREIERLLLWAVHEAGTPMSSLAAEDLAAYFAFLAKPPAHWVTPKVRRRTARIAAQAADDEGEAGLADTAAPEADGADAGSRGRGGADRSKTVAARARRDSDQWRPLRGKLSSSSIRQTRLILKAAFEWLCQSRYLASNPIALTRRKRQTSTRRIEHVLSQQTWAWFRDWLDLPDMPTEDHAMPASRSGERVRAALVFDILYVTALRGSEIASVRMRDFASRGEAGDWWIQVEGKGAKMDEVPVTDEVMDAISAYRVRYGCSALPAPGDPTPLLLPLGGPRDGHEPLTYNMVYRIVTEHTKAAAEAARRAGHERIAAELSNTSTHWMRHTSVTHQVDAGIDLRTVQRNARHASLATTSIYMHRDDELRHAELNAKLSLRGRATKS